MPRTASATVLPPARKSSGLPVEGLRGAASALAAWRARRGVALDITALPGMAILSSKVTSLKPVLLFKITLPLKLKTGYLVKPNSRDRLMVPKL